MHKYENKDINRVFETSHYLKCIQNVIDKLKNELNESELQIIKRFLHILYNDIYFCSPSLCICQPERLSEKTSKDDAIV